METLLTTLSFVAPILLGILLANFAVRDARLRHWVFAYLLVLYGFFALSGLCLLGLGLVLPRLAGNRSLPPEALNQFPGLSGAFTLAGPALGIGALLGALALAPRIRRLAARHLPIDPDAIMDVTALSLTLTSLGLAVANLAISAPILTNMPASVTAQLQRDSGWTLLTNLFLLLPPALLGVGLFIRRSPREALDRLGLTVARPAQLLLAFPLSLGMIVLAIFVVRVWAALDPASYKQTGDISNAMMGGLAAWGLWGAFAVGAIAGISEETLFRGALQPKLGIALPTVLFASLHTQYLLSPATALVLVIGLVMAVVRKRTGSTLICLLTHFLYNFTITILPSWLSGP